MPYLWDDAAWEDYQYWASQDKRMCRRINTLLKEISRSAKAGDKPFGKAELLKHSKSGLCSVRIDKANGLIYLVDGETVRIVSCKGHYQD